jgi:predicted nucleic acid-binding protein
VVVLDASTALTWCFVDEASVNDPRIMWRVHNEGAIVPAVWSIEVANGLLRGLRRQRLSQDELDVFLDLLRDLDIQKDEMPIQYAFTTILTTGRAYQLTAYDSSYLDLAQRMHLPLVTADKGLAVAASQAGVTLYP